MKETGLNSRSNLIKISANPASVHALDKVDQMKTILVLAFNSASTESDFF